MNVLWLGSSILAFYHFGIEKKLWQGFTECGSNLIFNENTLDQLLSKSPIRCDETQFVLLNISLAGWNGILSVSAKDLMTNSSKSITIKNPISLTKKQIDSLKKKFEEDSNY